MSAKEHQGLPKFHSMWKEDRIELDIPRSSRALRQFFRRRDVFARAIRHAARRYDSAAVRALQKQGCNLKAARAAWQFIQWNAALKLALFDAPLEWTDDPLEARGAQT